MLLLFHNKMHSKMSAGIHLLNQAQVMLGQLRGRSPSQLTAARARLTTYQGLLHTQHTVKPAYIHKRRKVAKPWPATSCLVQPLA